MVFGGLEKKWFMSLIKKLYQRIINEGDDGMCLCDYPNKTKCVDGLYCYDIKGAGVPTLNTRKFLHCKRNMSKFKGIILMARSIKKVKNEG